MRATNLGLGVPLPVCKLGTVRHRQNLSPISSSLTWGISMPDTQCVCVCLTHSVATKSGYAPFLFLQVGVNDATRMPGALGSSLSDPAPHFHSKGHAPPRMGVGRQVPVATPAQPPALSPKSQVGDRYAFSFYSRNSFPASFHVGLLLWMEIHQIPEATDDF